VTKAINGWLKEVKKPAIRKLEGEDLDLAVARGAAYYGLVRRGRGVRIRGGTAQTYYVGIESTMPAVPGMPAPLKAFCVAPFGMEEGSSQDLSGREFSLLVGEPATFRFLGSTTRKTDEAGTLLGRWNKGELEELTPLQVTLPPGDDEEEGADWIEHVVSSCLRDGGRAVFGDIWFANATARSHAREEHADRWDPDEHYWAMDEAFSALEARGLSPRFETTSFCGGVLCVTPG